MKKTIRLTETELVRLVKRIIREQSEVSSSDNMKKGLQSIVNYGVKVDYRKVCNFCKKQNVSPQNPRAEKAAQEFSKLISGVENPFSNIAGFLNKESSAYKAGESISKNLKSAEDICSMIKYYSKYSGTDEDFCEAVSGELSYKFDASTNLDYILGYPLAKILGTFQRYFTDEIDLI